MRRRVWAAAASAATALGSRHSLCSAPEKDEYLFLARHGPKEKKGSRPTNWELQLLPHAENQLKQVSAVLARKYGGYISRVICSPYPRCTITAGTYCRGLGIAEVAVEPGMCEKMTPKFGAQGQPLDAEGKPGPPTWSDGDLLAGLNGVPSAPPLRLVTDYTPIIPRSALRSMHEPEDASEVQERAGILAAHAEKGGFDGGTLLVGHSGLRRVVMLLTGEKKHGIPEGGVTVLRREAATGRWVVVEEISVERVDDDDIKVG